MASSTARVLEGRGAPNAPARSGSTRPPPPPRPATWRDALGRQASAGQRYEPRSRDELVAIVGEAARTGTAIRGVGAGHSSSAVARPEGAWIDLRALRRLLPVTVLRAGAHAASYVRAEAGIVLDDLHAELRARGVALPPSTPTGRQTLAGAIATGTHGSSLLDRSLADCVVSVEMVVFASDRGRLVPRLVRLEPRNGVTCPRHFAAERYHHGMDLVQDDELFEGAVVGLGATGIVCAYTLDVEAPLRMDERVFRMPWSQLEGELVDIARAHASLDVVFYPHPTGTLGAGLTRDDCITCVVTVRDPSDDAPATLPDGVPSVCAPSSPAPSASTGPKSAGAANGGAWGRASAMEISVALDDAPRAVRALLDEVEAIRRDGGRHAGPASLRFVAASRHALAMSHGRPTCSLEYALPAGARRAGADPSEDEGRAIVRRVQAAIDAVVPDARPHWGMVHELAGAELAARYPAAVAWRKACRAFDPRGYLLNGMTRGLLWGASGASGGTALPIDAG